jgi:hypothetical protein
MSRRLRVVRVRVRLSVTAFVCGAAVVCTIREARAECESPVRAPCINAESFWPRAGATRFAGIGGTELAPAGQVGVGLVTTFSHRPLVAALPAPGLAGSTVAAIDNIVTTNFLIHAGITPRLQLEVAVPLTLGQSGAGRSALSGASEPLKYVALRDVRFGLAYAIVPKRRVDVATEVRTPRAKGHTYGLAARLEFSAPVGSAAEFARDRTAVLSPSITGDYRRNRWFAAAELGMRIRGNSEFGATRVGTQILAAVGIGVDVLPAERFAAVAEVRHLIGLSEQRDLFSTGDGSTAVPNGKYLVPAEWSVGARSGGWFGGDLSVDLSVGGALPYGGAGGPTAPAFRMGIGVRFAPLGRDSDGDGVGDKFDKCPGEVGVRRSGESPDGCVHPPVAPDVPVEFTPVKPQLSPPAAVPHEDLGPTPIYDTGGV